MAHEYRLLRFCALFYALGLGLHTADHLRRGLDTVTPQVLWIGNISTVVGIGVVAAVVVGYRHAAMLAALTGLPVALGVAAVHLLPHWSAFSDSFDGAHGTGVTAMSWIVVLIEIAGAVALGTAGMRIVVREHANRAGAAFP